MGILRIIYTGFATQVVLKPGAESGYNLDAVLRIDDLFCEFLLDGIQNSKILMALAR